MSGNFNAAKYLINAKADFRTRDWHGRNLIHLALKHVTKSLNPDESSLSELLRLIPDSARREMFTEKSRTRTGLFTPLSYWIENLSANGRRPQLGYKVLRVLTSLGAKRSFHLYNGDGQSPLHQAVNAAFPSLVKALIRNERGLLITENVHGETPYELSRHHYSTYIQNHPPHPVNFTRQEIWTVWDVVHTRSICQYYFETYDLGACIRNEAKTDEVRNCHRIRKREPRPSMEIATDEIADWLDHGFF